MKVTITPEAERRLHAFIRRIDTEVGGFGYAKITEEGLVWDETFLVPQTVSGSEVEFDGGGIAAAVERAAQDGVLGQADHVWVSWHSHHNMGAFWSSTDEACIRTYAEAGILMLLSYVGTHGGKYKMRMDFFDVDHHGITIPTVTMDDIKFHTTATKREPDAIDQEIADNVKKRKFAQLTKQAKPWSTTTKDKRSEKLPSKEEVDATGLTLPEAFSVKQLMDNGFNYDDAVDTVLGVDEVTYGYDQMAWS